MRIIAYATAALAALVSVQARQYTVNEGDHLWQIAQNQCGDGNKWNQIHDANSHQIADPNLIHPGQVLDLPC